MLWRKGDYQACSKQLELLSALRPADPHVSVVLPLRAVCNARLSSNNLKASVQVETNKAAAAALLATQTAQDRVNVSAVVHSEGRKRSRKRGCELLCRCREEPSRSQ